MASEQRRRSSSQKKIFINVQAYMYIGVLLQCSGKYVVQRLEQQNVVIISTPLHTQARFVVKIHAFEASVCSN